jgi:hypothetical protein
VTTEQEDDLIADFTRDAWKAWVAAGWKDAFTQELGALRGEREEAIFHDAWKIGCSAGIRMARDLSDRFERVAKRN